MLQKSSKFELIASMMERLGVSPSVLTVQWLENHALSVACVVKNCSQNSSELCFDGVDPLKLVLARNRKTLEGEDSSSDIGLIFDMMRELQFSPYDVFKYWLESNEVDDVIISITYKSGEKVKLCYRETKQEGLPIKTSVVKQPEDNRKSSSRLNTSFSQGIINVKPEHYQNIKVGAFVYTTGDILLEGRALKRVNVRGIILCFDDRKITLLRYVGDGFSAISAAGESKDGWRFLTYDECKAVSRLSNCLNGSLSQLRRKQLDRTMRILFKSDDNKLSVFDLDSQRVKDALSSDNVADRIFYLYLVKDMKVV